MIYAVVFMAFCMPIWAAVGFYFGFNCGRSVEAVKELPEVKTPLPMVKKYQETEEERLQRLIDENIENFGTNIPQQDIV